MNDVELTELRKIESEKEAYQAQISVSNLQLINSLKSGLGDDIKQTLHKPQKPSIWKRFFYRLLKVCQ